MLQDDAGSDLTSAGREVFDLEVVVPEVVVVVVSMLRLPNIL